MATVSDLLDQIDAGPDDPDVMTDDDLGNWWAERAMSLATAVKADTVQVYVTYTAEEGHGRSNQTLTLPSWCSGDPAPAAALYLWGYADAVGVRNLTARVVNEPLPSVAD